MDDDRSNSLSMEEFTKGIHDYGCNMEKEEIQKMFTDIDRDGSGTLDFDEFLKALRVCELSMLPRYCFRMHFRSMVGLKAIHQF